MAENVTDIEQALWEGAPLPNTAEMVIGEDFYEDPEPDDSTYHQPHDPISVAVGVPGYMQTHRVQECRQEFAEGAWTESEEFDRYYFPQGHESLAPILIDIVSGVTPEERRASEDEKHVAFKREWCAGRNIRYVALHDLDMEMLSTEQLRAALAGEPPTPAAEPVAKAVEPRERGAVQRPGA